MTQASDIDLRDLFRYLFTCKYFIALHIGIAILISLAYAFLAPLKFESSVLLVPSDPNPEPNNKAAAMLLGNTLNKGSDLDLYQALLTSRTVIRQLALCSLANLRDTARGRVEPLYQIFGILPQEQDPKAFGDFMEVLRGSVKVYSSGEAGQILYVNVVAPDPWLAKEMADRLVDIGQEQLRQVKMEKYRNVIARLQKVVETAQNEWKEVAARHAAMQEAERDLTQSAMITQARILKQEEVQIEKKIKEQTYLIAKKELEAQLLEMDRTMPPTVILDHAELPYKKSSPKRTLILVFGALLGFLLSVSYHSLRFIWHPQT